MDTFKNHNEKRRRERKSVEDNTRVFVYHRDKKVGKGYIRDISVGGVYLERIKNLPVPLGSIVKLTFIVELEDGVVHVHRKSGIIVRTKGNNEAAFSIFSSKTRIGK